MLAAPYGQLEIRPPVGAIAMIGSGTPPGPVPVLSTQLGESVEGAIVAVDVVIDKAARRDTNGGVTVDALDPRTGGRFAIRADASSGIATSDLPPHSRARLVGVAGQRATRTGRLDGYRIWLRDRADIVLAGPTASGSPSPSGSAPAGSAVAGSPSVSISIAQALVSPGVPVRVLGTVTAAGRLLDSTGRLVVIQDATAAIAVRLPTGAATPRVGVLLRVDGSVGRAYGAPRLAATAATGLGTGMPILPLAIRAAPGVAHEWRLVRLEGVVTDVHRLGDRWRADVAIGSIRVLVTGLPGAAIPASALLEGRRAIVIGVIRRPYPTGTDRRFAVVPRSAADVRLGPPARTGGADDPAGDPGSTAGTGTDGTGAPGPGPAGPLDVDLGTLAEHRGEIVRVGGIVTAVASGSVMLDDGTSIGRLTLSGDAATYLPLLAPGDALDAVGRVGGSPPALAIEVTRASDIVRVGDPGADPGGAGTFEPAGSPSAGPGTAGEGEATTSSEGTSPTAAAAILIAAAAAAALAVLVTVGLAVRRRRERRSMNSRIALRVASLAGSRPDPLTPA